MDDRPASRRSNRQGAARGQTFVTVTKVYLNGPQVGDAELKHLEACRTCKR